MNEHAPGGRARVDRDVSAPPAFALERLPGPAGTLVLRLAGELDVATSGALRAHLEPALAGVVRGVVLDLEEVSFVDSSALRELIRLRAAVQAGEGVVVLVAPPPPVHRLLELTGTAELFARASTRDEALALATAP